MVSRTLLSLAEEAAEAAGLHAPASIIGNNEKVARRIEHFANRTVDTIRLKAADNDGWGAQQVGTTITLASGTEYYDLPQSYEALIPGAAFLESQFTFWGPTDPYDYRAVEAGLYVNPTRYRWRVMHDKIRIQPTPTAVDTVYIEYLTNAMVESTEAAAWDVAVWDQDVWDATTIANRFLDDDDQVRFPDYLLSLGLTARLLQWRGEPYAEAQLEFEQKLEIAIARDKGGPRRSMTLAYMDRMQGGDVAFGQGSGYVSFS